MTLDIGSIVTYHHYCTAMAPVQQPHTGCGYAPCMSTNRGVSTTLYPIVAVALQPHYAWSDHMIDVGFVYSIK